MTTPSDHVLKEPTEAVSATSPRYGLVIVAAGFIVTMTTIGSGRYLYPVVLPSMKDSLGLSYGLAGALASAISGGYLGFCLLSGVLAVRFGSRTLVSLSTLAVGLAMLGQAFTSWYPLAFFLMLVIGVGAAGAYIPTAGLITAWFPPRRRGVFMGISTVGANVGILATAVFGPLILLAYGGTGWRMAWIFFGLAALVAGTVGYLTLRDRPAGTREPQGQPDPRAGPASQNWRDVFRSRSMLGLTIAYLSHGFFSIYVVFLIAFATRGLGQSTEFAGTLWFLLSGMSVVTLVIWGYLSDVVGRKRTIIPCALVLALSIVIPIFRQDAVSLYVSAILFGATFVGPMTIITVAAGDLVGPAMAAAAMGLVTMGHGVGQMLGPAVAGFLIDASGSFYPGFIIAAAAIVIEILIIARLPLATTRPRDAKLEAP